MMNTNTNTNTTSIHTRSRTISTSTSTSTSTTNKTSHDEGEELDSSSNNNNNNPNLTEEELRSKLKEYIHFIDNILQPELERAVSKREEVEFEIEEYNELKATVQMFIERRKENTKTNTEKQKQEQKQKQKQEQMSMVDLTGSQLAYCRATIENPDRIFVDVGTKTHVHVELTLEEATVAIDKRIRFLEAEVLPRRVDRAKTVANHLEQALSLLESLGKEAQIQGPVQSVEQ